MVVNTLLIYLLALLEKTLPKRWAARGSRPTRRKKKQKKHNPLFNFNAVRWNVKKQEGPPAGKITFTLWKLD
jgi:hypothetical protein